MRWYILVDRFPILATLEEWAKFRDDFAHCIVAKDQVGPYRVSTIFLGHDPRLLHEGPPALFETMIFGDGGPIDNRWFYHSWAEAEAGHREAVAWLSWQMDQHQL